MVPVRTGERPGATSTPSRPPPACSAGTGTTPLARPHRHGMARHGTAPDPRQPRPGPERQRGPSPPGFVQGGGRPALPPAPLLAHQPPAAAAGFRSALRSATAAATTGRVAIAAPRGPGGSGRPAPLRLPARLLGARRGQQPGWGQGGTPRTRVSPLCTKHSHPLQEHMHPSATHPPPSLAALTQTCPVSGTSPPDTDPLGGMQAPTHPSSPALTLTHAMPLQGHSQRTPHACTPTPGMRMVLDPAGRHWEPDSSLILTKIARQKHGEVQPEGMLRKEEKFAGFDLTVQKKSDGISRKSQTSVGLGGWGS